MEKITTATGKEFDCDYLVTIPQPPRAYIRVCNADIATVAAVFNTPEETRAIQYGTRTVLDHTRLVTVSPEGDAIKVCLAKE